MPIVIGGDKQFNACAGAGEVIGLNSKGGEFLSVQTGPDRAYREIDRLFNGNKVYICNSWYSVIYSAGRELTQQCGVGKPVGNTASLYGTVSVWLGADALHQDHIGNSALIHTGWRLRNHGRAE